MSSSNWKIANPAGTAQKAERKKTPEAPQLADGIRGRVHGGTLPVLTCRLPRSTHCHTWTSVGRAPRASCCGCAVQRTAQGKESERERWRAGQLASAVRGHSRLPGHGTVRLGDRIQARSNAHQPESVSVCSRHPGIGSTTHVVLCFESPGSRNRTSDPAVRAGR